MPSPLSGTPSPSPEISRAVRAIDILCLALVIVSVVVALSGGFRIWFGGWRIAVTSPYPLLLWALAIGIIRHFIAPATPIYHDLPERLAAWWREPSVHTAVIVVAGTRPAILFVGYMAVLMFGYPPGSEPPKQMNDELINLSARWDANWYLGIATEGYHYVPNQPGLQQSIAFFPAYPMLVRIVARILGGHVPGYIGAGLFISFAAFFGALVYLYALARDSLGEDEARFALWLAATYPFALFFSAIYAEPLLLFGLVATFYHFTNGRFARATMFGLLVGLTKTNGFLLSIPLAMLAVSPLVGTKGWTGRTGWMGSMRGMGWQGGAGGSAGPGEGGRTDGTGRTSGDSVAPHRVLAALLAASAPSVGMLIYSAFVYTLSGDPLAWLKAHGAWGREYQGLAVLVGDRINIIANAGVQGYVASLPHDLMNALGVVFVLACAWPVARKLGLAYAVFILVFILPPLAAGGLISAGRFSSVLFPAFLWMAGAVQPRHRAAWLVSFAAIQALNAALFYTWRPLY
jgi:hypothetical protein